MWPPIANTPHPIHPVSSRAPSHPRARPQGPGASIPPRRAALSPWCKPAPCHDTTNMLTEHTVCCSLLLGLSSALPFLNSSRHLWLLSLCSLCYMYAARNPPTALLLLLAAPAVACCLLPPSPDLPSTQVPLGSPCAAVLLCPVGVTRPRRRCLLWAFLTARADARPTSCSTGCWVCLSSCRGRCLGTLTQSCKRWVMNVLTCWSHFGVLTYNC